jgi:hypothetical protein
MKEKQTHYKIKGGYSVEFTATEDEGIEYWRWVLYEGAEELANSGNHYYKCSLSNARRGFRSVQKAMARFKI